MSQTIQVNPVELATYLASNRIDELYQADEIPYPYEDNKEFKFVPWYHTKYTKQGQITFDSQYKWYYKVITSHERKPINKEVEYEIIEDDENNYHDMEDVLGEYDGSKLIELYNWREGKVNTYTIYKYEDKYILERTFINKWGYYDESCDLIKLINP